MLVNGPSFQLGRTTRSYQRLCVLAASEAEFPVVRKGAAACRIDSGRAGRDIGDANCSNGQICAFDAASFALAGRAFFKVSHRRVG